VAATITISIFLLKNLQIPSLFEREDVTRGERIEEEVVLDEKKDVTVESEELSDGVTGEETVINREISPLERPDISVFSGVSREEMVTGDTEGYDESVMAPGTVDEISDDITPTMKEMEDTGDYIPTEYRMMKDKVEVMASGELESVKKDEDSMVVTGVFADVSSVVEVGGDDIWSRGVKAFDISVYALYNPVNLSLLLSGIDEELMDDAYEGFIYDVDDIGEIEDALLTNLFYARDNGFWRVIPTIDDSEAEYLLREFGVASSLDL